MSRSAQKSVCQPSYLIWWMWGCGVNLLKGLFFQELHQNVQTCKINKKQLKKFSPTPTPHGAGMRDRNQFTKCFLQGIA